MVVKFYCVMCNFISTQVYILYIYIDIPVWAVTEVVTVLFTQQQ